MPGSEHICTLRTMHRGQDHSWWNTISRFVSSQSASHYNTQGMVFNVSNIAVGDYKCLARHTASGSAGWQQLTYAHDIFVDFDTVEKLESTFLDPERLSPRGSS